MSTEMQKETKTTTKIDDYLMTNTGTLIVGSELVGNKLTALLCEAIKIYNESDSHPVVVTIRNDGYPKDALGMTYGDTYSIVLNVRKMWDNAVAMAEKGEKHISLPGAILVNFLATIAHELDHMDLLFGDRDLYETMRASDEGQKDVEQSAKDNEINMLIQLARDVDTELPSVAEMGWFGVKIMDLFTNEETKDLDWVARHRRMMDKSQIYLDEDNEIEKKSFRDFVQHAYEVKDASGWEQPVAHVNIEAHLENGSVELTKAEILPEPKVEVAEPKQELEPDTKDVALANDAGIFVQVVEDEPEPEDTPDEPTELDPANVVGLDAGADNAALHEHGADGNGAADDANAKIPANVPGFIPPVPDTQPVADQKAAFQAAASTAIPPKQEIPTTYADNGVEDAVFVEAMKNVYQLLYHHVFTKCGWQQNPQTGKFYFSQAASALQGVDVRPVLNHYGISNLVMSYDTTDAQGKYAAEEFAGMIRGHVTSKAGVPRYVLYLNYHGQRVQRTFVPQNPEKRNAQNAYGQNALAAQQGSHIAYILKGEAPAQSSFIEKCSVIINNNDYQVIG